MSLPGQSTERRALVGFRHLSSPATATAEARCRDGVMQTWVSGTSGREPSGGAAGPTAKFV